MSRSSRSSGKIDHRLVEVKSKFDAEFRRFSVGKQVSPKYEEFQKLVEKVHELQTIPFVICYTEPIHGDLLPINNDDNFHKALTTAKPLLRLFIQSKADAHGQLNGYGTVERRKRNPITKLIQGEPRPKSMIQISMPEDFRRVSAIIDVDIIPETHRRVKLMKNGSDKPLGFYIRDGTSVRVTPHGLEKVAGIFISRLVPGGLAESTGLLAVNDEVLEVNGIEVAGKTLDQVTDMMVANSSNLVITVKPVNQRNNIGLRGMGSQSGSGRQSQKSSSSIQSAPSLVDSDEVPEIIEEDDDVVHNHLRNENSTLGSGGGDNTSHKDTSIHSEDQVIVVAKPPEQKNGDIITEKPKDKDSAVVTL